MSRRHFFSRGQASTFCYRRRRSTPPSVSPPIIIEDDTDCHGMKKGRRRECGNLHARTTHSCVVAGTPEKMTHQQCSENKSVRKKRTARDRPTDPPTAGNGVLVEATTRARILTVSWDGGGRRWRSVYRLALSHPARISRRRIIDTRQ